MFFIADAVIDQENYLEFRNVLYELNGVKEDQAPKFRNKKAEEYYYKMLEVRKKHNQDSGLYLKDICSILCNAEGNGISVFNIGELTLYQVYEHFERLSVKESHRRMLKVWANGHLKEDTKLQDWLVKTNL